jgi:dTDP-glucose 4,6-dehydratase
MNRVLVTGGMGFIGSNFIRYMLERYGDDGLTIINLDLLTYAGNPENLRDAESHPRYRFVHGDILDARLVGSLLSEGVDTIVHFAAESHVDRSISDPQLFLKTNVLGTHTLLQEALKKGVKLFLHISTDEVYGSLGAKGSFTERTPARPNSPYSASKAASDFIVRSYGKTYGLPVIISRCSNNYGPYQHPEKLIPKAVIRALQNRPIPIYGDGGNIRDWLHVRDHCAALDLILRKGTPGEVYNVGGGNERTNLDIVRMILDETGRPESLIRFVDDRPGHDRRYAMNARKLRKDTGWAPAIPLQEGIRQTIAWYAANADWWTPLMEGGDE